MLSELSVQNLLIVERARLEMGGGLAAITGETGAGKSLLLDALDLLAGGRARAELVGPWGDDLQVAAVFNPAAAVAVRVETACGVPAEQGAFIVRRRVARSGRSQAWINDQPVTVAALRAAAGELVEIQAQQAAVRLADIGAQMELLDAFGGHQAAAAAYGAEHGRVLALQAELARLDGGERESLRELEFLRFQSRELQALAPERGEYQRLRERAELLAGAAGWRDLCAEAEAALAGDHAAAVTRQLDRFARRLQPAPERTLVEAGGQLAQALELVRDAAAACAAAGDRLGADPGERERVEARLDAYHDLMRKHGDGEDALFSAWESVDRRSAELEGLDQRRADVAAHLERSLAERGRLGRELAQQREAAFAALAKEVHRHLADLGMGKARLSLAAGAGEEPSPLGLVRQEFRLAANPGLPAASIGDAASGGEAARLLLALAAASAGCAQLPLVVFDEIDSGTGGRLGASIGAKLAALAQARTVIAITHAPQVAAAAGRHFAVRKQQGRQETRAVVEQLEGENRVAELAAMFGGGTQARAQSRALLAGEAR